MSATEAGAVRAMLDAVAAAQSIDDAEVCAMLGASVSAPAVGPGPDGRRGGPVRLERGMPVGFEFGQSGEVLRGVIVRFADDAEGRRAAWVRIDAAEGWVHLEPAVNLRPLPAVASD